MVTREVSSQLAVDAHFPSWQWRGLTYEGDGDEDIVDANVGESPAGVETQAQNHKGHGHKGAHEAIK